MVLWKMLYKTNQKGNGKDNFLMYVGINEPNRMHKDFVEKKISSIKVCYVSGLDVIILQRYWFSQNLSIGFSKFPM